MTEYKVGDRVVVVRREDENYAQRGEVVGIDESFVMPIEVQFDDRWLRYGAHELERAPEPAPDVVSHPPHYRDGVPPGIEVIDIIRAHMRVGGTWETANALKYILRHPLKNNPTQDIAKATQYLAMWTKQQETAA